MSEWIKLENLERLKKRVTQAEQERIIKLLEQLIANRPENWPQAKGYYFEDVIALIKGEQNA